MKGLVIITAGREDAYRDYVRCVRDGVAIDDVEGHVSDELLRTIDESEEERRLRVWGTTVENQWRKIESGDIMLAYREGKFVARARVISTEENLPLAEQLWRYGDNTWDEDNPWRFLVYVDQFEEIDVPLEEFNALIGYEDNYIPQGFTRVSDRRIRGVLEDYDSLENAIADLTGTGERVHEIDSDDEGDEPGDAGSTERLKRDLIAASEDGSRSEEFERLVADAFSRLGCESRWIEGGSDTDVEITYPAQVVVEAKSRGTPHGIRNINAAGIVRHRNQRGAEHGLVVGRHFPPQAIEDAERNEITTLTTDQLVSLLEKREAYGIPPERIFEHLLEPGAFQEDRQDLLQDHIDERFDAVESMLAILKGIQRSTDPVTASQLRFILLGMSEDINVPQEDEIAHSLQFLSHPSLQLLERRDDGYVLTTNFDNAIDVLASVGSMVDTAANTRES